ncbi:hypothetical protein L4X63_22325 [Geomonas sp. Red32]|uniref:hypothetical protein n=1 Tax=Geomonas sp. Red32 TaxID=2912856 RepID=UPI00202CFF27|nr:hypothetical protein [Geomonas sp. Red32]MCM0084325.1 hypothetical protein [Geomonas sp. Red32]
MSRVKASHPERGETAGKRGGCEEKAKKAKKQTTGTTETGTTGTMGTTGTESTGGTSTKWLVLKRVKHGR